MENYNTCKLAKDEYYHGTMHYKAIQILYEGFRLKKNYTDHGRHGTFRQGIYLTKSLSSANYFGLGYIFKCHLKKGASVLRINNNYDKKIINYLKREFSKSILTGDISKAMPRNKHLTRNELINLVNYRFKKASWRTEKDIEKWWSSACSIRQQLKLHKYDGIGELEDLDGMVIFNPSFVEPIELCEFIQDGEKLSLQKLNNEKFIFEIDKYFEEEIELFGDESRKEWEIIQPFELRFCRENGLL